MASRWRKWLFTKRHIDPASCYREIVVSAKAKLDLILWVLSGITLVLVLTLISIVAFQQYRDRLLQVEIERTSDRLLDLGTQIASIKDANLVSINDYIAAYAQILPLESEYDNELQRIKGLYARAQHWHRQFLARLAESDGETPYSSATFISGCSQTLL